MRLPFFRYRKPYFGWWAVAWGLYLLRIVAITSFLLSSDWIWLYWHQVVTGWTALALLYAALVFSQQIRWRWRYLGLVLFPPIWSYIAIYRLDHFLWAAGPSRPLPQPGHPVDRLGVLPVSPEGPVQRRHTPGRGVWALGTTPPRLPVSSCPWRLGALGILPRHPAGASRRSRDPASRPGRSAPGTGGVVCALSGTCSERAGSRTCSTRSWHVP